MVYPEALSLCYDLMFLKDDTKIHKYHNDERKTDLDGKFYIMMKAQHIIMKHVWDSVMASIAATGSSHWCYNMNGDSSS